MGGDNDQHNAMSKIGQFTVVNAETLWKRFPFDTFDYESIERISTRRPAEELLKKFRIVDKMCPMIELDASKNCVLITIRHRLAGQAQKDGISLLILDVGL
jgi:hypothetical protein